MKEFPFVITATANTLVSTGLPIWIRSIEPYGGDAFSSVFLDELYFDTDGDPPGTWACHAAAIFTFNETASQFASFKVTFGRRDS